MIGGRLGGGAGMAATCFVQPLDLVKTRMQMSGIGGGAREHKTAFHALINIARSEGPLALYNGLSAGLLRQATYTTTRLGIYTSLMDSFKKPDENITFLPQTLSTGKTTLEHGSLGVLFIPLRFYEFLCK